MPEVNPARANLLVEETQYRGAVSEALLQKMAGTNNFINERQFDTQSFKLNGQYGVARLQTGLDGLYVCLFKMEIVGISGYSVTSGSSGATTYDLHRITSPGVDGGSVFDVKPSFDSTSSDNSYFLKNIITNTDIVTGTGITTPEISALNRVFEAGEAIRFDVDDTLSGGKNSGLNIHYRPIN